MALDTTQLLLIEQRITNESPNGGVAYVLWFFLGLIGAHRFYLGQVATGVVMLILSITGVGLIATSVWWVVDAFLIPDMMRVKRDQLRRQMMTEMLAYAQPAGASPPPSGVAQAPVPAAAPSRPPSSAPDMPVIVS